MSTNWYRWVPAAAVPALVAVGLATSGASAASPPAPATAEQVLALVAAHRTHQFSGEVEQRTDLGLPSIPAKALGSDAGAGNTAAILDLLTTGHTARVYVDGPTKQRVQVMDQLAERDAIRSGTSAWTWDSATKRATHTTLPTATASSGAGPLTPDSPSPAAATPDELAQHVLATVGPSTTVTVGDPVTVANHGAWTLVLTPRTTGSLVASVRIAVESTTGLPLAVDVYAKGQADPAFHVALTSLDLRAPDPSVFSFTPPAGATVTQQQLPTASHRSRPLTSSNQQAAKETAGTAAGWDAVTVIPAARVPADLTRSPLVTQVATRVPGGRLLSTSLVNVLLTDDGRLLAGAVPASTLEAAAR
ncbi:hypothetical protein [Tersicoccus sp. Bi-70]|uniref:LolA family protein n=1 Tax=Tersicoccus sp. Bi-70 TaxID=1897634 RepID=UPI0009774D6C|nr:hypothetical protein [Tersicoccus sp. Bi-70]OMH31194.1 hypothetical protein BGP79_09060 [Tersicoccus sp. Bi-70]